MSQTGFFRVTIAKRNDNKYYKYQIRNRLVHKEIIAKDIMDLKRKVEKYGFLWGILDIQKAQENSGDYKLKALQGKYGEKVGE